MRNLAALLLVAVVVLLGVPAQAACPDDGGDAKLDVTSRNVPQGVAVVFKSDGHVDAAELRQRADRFARDNRIRLGRIDVRNDVRVNGMKGGARVTFKPRDPEDLALLRKEAQDSARQLSGKDVC